MRSTCAVAVLGVSPVAAMSAARMHAARAHISWVVFRSATTSPSAQSTRLRMRTLRKLTPSRMLVRLTPLRHASPHVCHLALTLPQPTSAHAPRSVLSCLSLLCCRAPASVTLPATERGSPLEGTPKSSGSFVTREVCQNEYTAAMRTPCHHGIVAASCHGATGCMEGCASGVVRLGDGGVNGACRRRGALRCLTNAAHTVGEHISGGSLTALLSRMCRCQRVRVRVRR